MGLGMLLLLELDSRGARSSVWSERRPFKPRVRGSNPLGPASTNTGGM